MKPAVTNKNKTHLTPGPVMINNVLCVQDSDLFQYHVIPKVLLFPNKLDDGMMKSTLLGSDYEVQFHLNDKNQVTTTSTGSQFVSCSIRFSLFSVKTDQSRHMNELLTRHFSGGVFRNIVTAKQQ